MYAHFNDIKLNDEIRSDLISAGHMIQNVLDGKAGAALDRKESSGNMVVKVDADDAIAPIFTAVLLMILMILGIRLLQYLMQN